MKKVVFRVRREYFDDIVSRNKKFELRADTDFWRKRLLGKNRPKVAVFICGKDKHICRITYINVGRPQQFLGRPLSRQGKKDIPTGLCIAVHLGQAIETNLYCRVKNPNNFLPYQEV